MKRLRVLVSLMFFIVILIQPVLADNNNIQKQDKQFDRAKFFEKLNKDLNLTDEQKTKIQTLQAEQQNIVPNTMKELRQKYNDLTTELSKEKYDKNIINSLTEEILSIEKKLSLDRINTKIKMRDILSTEQFKRLEENMHKMHKHKPNN